MAEGGDLPSIKDGSDADFEFVCTPCSEDDIREEAVKYCLECDQYLCSTCTRCHRRSAASKSHKLVVRENAKDASIVAIVTKCRNHSERDIEMYCGTHDMVYCSLCIATEHRACENVKRMEDMDIAVNESETEVLIGETKDVQTNLSAAHKKKQGNISLLEEQNNDILQKIEDTKNALTEHITKLEKEAVQNWKREYSDIKEKLESELIRMGKTMTELEKTETCVKNISRMDARQQFVQTKMLKSSINYARELYEDYELKGTLIARFTVKDDLRKAVMQSIDIGMVETSREKQKQPTPREYKMRSKKDINVRTRNDGQTCYLSNICLLEDGSILLTDYYNKKVKLMDVNYTIKCHLDLNSNPRAICYINGNEVAVELVNNIVQFISVGCSLAVLREITIQGGGNWGMEYCAGELWVGNGSCVNVYSTSGSLLKTIDKNANGQSIFRSSVNHMAVSKETVIVTDNSDGAVCFGKDGAVKRELRDGRLKNCRGVCISRDGTVFLSGRNSNSIVMFSAEGNCLGEVVTREDGITCPFSLCYDSKRNVLIVTRNASDDIIYLLEM